MKHLQTLGGDCRLGGQYEPSLSSLLLFLSVPVVHFLVILRLHPYVLSPKLSEIDSGL